MTQKIIEYRTVSSPNIAQRAVKYFKKKYSCDYNWALSYDDIENAIAVCILETECGNRYVTTTSKMSYIEHRRIVKTIEDIGELW